MRNEAKKIPWHYYRKIVKDIVGVGVNKKRLIEFAKNNPEPSFNDDRVRKLWKRDNIGRNTKIAKKIIAGYPMTKVATDAGLSKMMGSIILYQYVCIQAQEVYLSKFGGCE